MTTDDTPLIRRLHGFGTTIFSEMTALALAHEAVNLGQGYPDADGPESLLAAAQRAIGEGRNQYAPGPGIASLRQAVAAHQQRFWGLEFDPDTEVTVTAGATEAVAASLLALCEVGDEVVCFEPYYDSYAANLAMAGAVRRTVPLAPDDDGRWRYDPDRLEAAIGPRTRLLLLNSPHNPTGKVFTDGELAHLARLCVEHDLLAVTDEVYEHLAFDQPHRPLACYPGMRDRTVTISSAGKTFSVTGWKVGWLCAAPALTRAVRTVKQYLSFSNGTPFQHAVAGALALDDGFYRELANGYRQRRDQLASGLAELGFGVPRAEGTYFVTADIRPLGEEDGMAFCRSLPGSVGVAAVPNVAFHDDLAAGLPFVRFAVCKRPELLDEALSRLAALPGAKASGGAR